ncbi:pyridoxamine 5'-phosphate oxidase-related protein FMN-binding [Beutenbergia cavernae DSM 12333]|uniref:Pyridoxamine 5'-phosphate oxidase-related protein FMN-binding n=1 Tax=Beutenbergia cavernae (strain ATCC BAA-8 / DSM 12333 / CCUG 43141 / JCM 11478 / NBRC 16432 / NCIMB 13614 / HKI 0122) TaxID=471853 RepID=C5BY76_BEUC1|nr:TIGR03668 family PPOX class F420-dependent oxidoreductase [Beutenbergia cavernae]ACQ80976.1 pyridoxamine 5'-phosphate oxidase-related protein FMN-binding [Beutenbergia cavernae DSM 12333]
MSPQECRVRFAGAPHAYLATADADGVPHLVPVVVAVGAGAGPGGRDVVVHAVDHKPKRSPDLRRLANIRANPTVALLADSYDDDWSRLWWVRADAHARVVDGGPELEQAIELLVARHPQYADRRPDGPAVVAEVTRWSGWKATPG